MDYFNDVLATFQSLDRVRILAVDGRVRELSEFIKNILIFFCSEHEWRSYRFGTTWGQVINDSIYIFGWTIPLISTCCIHGLSSVSQAWYSRLWASIFEIKVKKWSRIFGFTKYVINMPCSPSNWLARNRKELMLHSLWWFTWWTVSHQQVRLLFWMTRWLAKICKQISYLSDLQFSGWWSHRSSCQH